jgi:glycine betaine catabolism A
MTLAPSIPQALRREYYTSPAIFETEFERIFEKRWVCVGRADQIANPGDYFLQQIGSESIIITRNRDGLPKAFHNVCRHRGTQICEATEGKFRNSIQCPYHAWTYSLDGKLIGAPNMANAADFVKQDYPLYGVQTETWQGFLFVNLDPDAEPFFETVAAINPLITDWNISDLKMARRVIYNVDANWKLLAENYSECYHCPLIHPALNAMSAYDSGEDLLFDGPVVGGYMELREGHESMTVDGETQRVPVGTVGGADLRRVYYYVLFPNLLLSLHPDYVMFHTIWPKSPTETQIICEWLFDPQTMARPDFNPSDAVDFWDQTNREDWHICEQSQIGMRSRVYQPGPLYATQERILYGFDQEVLRSLGNS